MERSREDVRYDGETNPCPWPRPCVQVDERAVLKHFEWPENKEDALREAAFGYCDLKKLEVEASSFRDDARQPCSTALKKMQALFEK